MSNAKSRLSPAIAAFVVLVLGAWALWAGKPASRVASSDKAAAFPVNLGGWEGKQVSVEDRAKEILETDAVDLFEYKIGEEPPVWVSRVSGFGNRAAFHPPELCYVGGHFEVLERAPLTVTVNGKQKRLMRLVIGQGKEKFEAWYWFTANDRITPSYYQQQLWLLMYAMRKIPSSGTLVRISTVLDEPSKSGKRLLGFLSSLDDYLTRHANAAS